jgi:hypothetical protein
MAGAGTIAAVCVVLTAAAGRAAVMSVGNDTGAPGERVSFSLSIDPRERVTNFQCELRYDRTLLALDKIEISDQAWENGIWRLWYREASPGRVEIETESDCAYYAERISRLAILHFRISTDAYSTTTPVGVEETPRWEDDCSGEWEHATPQDGSVTIVGGGPTPTPKPSGKPPEVNLRMESTAVYLRGEEPVVRCAVRAHDWAGYREDAYLAVAVPGGGLLYRDSRGNLTEKPTPVSAGIRVENLSIPVGFGAIPTTAPAGLYTVYGTLCRRGKNPVRESNRISNLASAQFQVVETPSASDPAP